MRIKIKDFHSKCVIIITGNNYRRNQMASKITISLRIDKEELENLKKIARNRSINENKDIYYTDLIRDAIQERIRNEKT